MTLSGEEFIRRYLQHILPKGFMRIRHFGFLANRCRKVKLDCIRRKLQDEEATTLVVESSVKNNTETSSREKYCKCLKCQQGRLVVCFEVGVSFREPPDDT